MKNLILLTEMITTTANLQEACMDVMVKGTPVNITAMQDKMGTVLACLHLLGEEYEIDKDEMLASHATKARDILAKVNELTQSENEESSDDDQSEQPADMQHQSDTPSQSQSV